MYKAILSRYQRALKRIGGAGALLNLPKQIRQVLEKTNDLTVKTKMLEMIADAMNK